MVGVRVKDADDIQSAPRGFGLATQHVVGRDEEAVVLLLGLPLVGDGQDVGQRLVMRGGMAQQQAGALVGVSGLAVGLDGAQQGGWDGKHQR